MFEQALYYPEIEIRDDKWLKSAALFWDRIETIVPESMDCPYTRRTSRALEDEGILVPHRVNPLCEEIRGVEQDVVKYMDTSEGKKSFRKPWMRTVAQGINKLGGEYFSDDKRKMFEEKYKDFFIHVDKLPSILRDKLAGHQNDDGFVWAREGFMTFYMTLLANRICRNNDMALLTRNVSYNNLSNRIFKDRISCDYGVNNHTRRAMMYQIAMDDIIISPSTSIDSIINFRKKRQQELNRFRVEMDRLTNFDTDGMSVLDIENEFKKVYAHYILPSVNDVKATLKDARIAWLTGPVACAFSGLIPYVATMDIGSTSSIVTMIGQSLSLGLSSIPVVRNLKARRNPYAYLVRTRQFGKK